MCVARATTVGDQLEAVRGEYNNAFNSAKNKAESWWLYSSTAEEKVQATAQRVWWIKCQQDKFQ